jgi:beta-glucosidase
MNRQPAIASRHAALAVALVLGLAACGSNPPPDTTASAPTTPTTSPWPEVQWPLPADAALESRIDALLGSLSLEEKVAQLVQADIASVTPDDVRKYRLGSVLAGGNSDPGGRYDASPAEWLALADAFYAASMDTSTGGKAIPILFGIDAVHGQSNIVGATLFPHNIGLGAMRNPELMRKVGEVTAIETRVTGMEWAFAPTVAVPQDDRWGRSYEGYSESPDVVASYAGAMVEGLQGRVGSEGVSGRPPRHRFGQAFPRRRWHHGRQGSGRYGGRRSHAGARARRGLSARHRGRCAVGDGFVQQLQWREDAWQSAST